MGRRVVGLQACRVTGDANGSGRLDCLDGLV